MRQPFCRDGRLMIADPQWDDPLHELDLGPCEDCDCDMKQCDCCGEMRDDVTTFFYPPVGDTSACSKCRGESA